MADPSNDTHYSGLKRSQIRITVIHLTTITFKKATKSCNSTVKSQNNSAKGKKDARQNTVGPVRFHLCKTVQSANKLATESAARGPGTVGGEGTRKGHREVSAVVDVLFHGMYTRPNPQTVRFIRHR